MTLYLYMLIGGAVGAGAGLAIAALKKQHRADSNPFGRASLIGAIVGGVIAAIVFNATSLGYEHSEDVIDIKSEEQFNKIVLQSDKPVLVDFYFEKCPPCGTMAPIIAEIAEDEKGARFIVASVDVRKNDPWIARYYPGRVPYFVVFKNGRKVAESGKTRSKEALLQLLEPHIK